MSDPLTIFLTIMAMLLITPLVSEWIHLPGIVGLIVGGMMVGPYGFKLLELSSSIEMLSTIGLLYLMFSAGLEVDLHQFKRVQNRAFVFGGLTYAIPQFMGMALGRTLGLSWLGAVLLGSAFSSHTLIAFPILTRLGIVRNEAVSVTVGATVFTDITAFLVLAMTLGFQGGHFSADFLIKLLIELGVLAVLVLWGFPRVGKLFLQRFHGRAIEFQFVLVVLFVIALLAEIIGVHAVVGAFLAGLAINATLPRQSAITSRVLFVGESLFIPIFLVHSGMITNPGAFLTSNNTILIGLGVSLVAYASKFVAAWLAARIFKYSIAEMWVIWGLSQAQAAVTIPTLVIGLQNGLFNDILFNAAIMMILFTSLTSPLIVQRYGRLIKPVEIRKERQDLFERVLVSIANPETQEHLVSLSSLVAHNRNGVLIALNVAQELNGNVLGLDEQRELLNRVPELLADPEAALELERRIDTSLAHGILRAAIELDASLIVMGWRGHPTMRHSILGSMIDEVVWKAKVPVLVGRITTPVNALQRVIVAIPQENLATGLVSLTLDLALTMAQALNVPLFILVRKTKFETITRALKNQKLDLAYKVTRLEGEAVRAISQQVNHQDLILVTELGAMKHFRRSLGSIPERLTRATASSIVFVHYPVAYHEIKGKPTTNLVV
jgi:Kef-type K+ transport system membrane component KefB/nucleotide-binding universal stress UspA family protein